MPSDRESPRGHEGPWNESNPPRGVTPPSGSSSAAAGSQHGSSHGHGYYRPWYRGHYPYYYYGLYPRYYGSYLHFGLGFYPHYYYYPYAYDYPRAVRVVGYEPQGALDLNVKPKDTQVFVNGYYVGATGDFDGWPRYLWLDEDTYELIFYKQGYETVVREIAVRPDLVIDVKFRMQPGPSTAPEDLTRYRGEDDRYDRDDDRDRYDRDDDRDRYDRDRYDRDRYGRDRYERDRDYGAPSAGRAPAPAPAEEPAVPAEAGRVRFTISPPEAAVYLDGRFVGIGGELSAVREGLLMDSGEHHLQVFHPQHETVEKTITVKAGEEVGVEIDLTR